MGPKKVIKMDSGKLMLARSNAEAEEEVEERVGVEKEVVDYTNMTVAQLRDIVRERGMASPKAKTKKADIVARLLETERPKMKRKLVEVEKEETGKMIKSRSYGKLRKSPQEYFEEDQDRETNGVIWLVESEEFWAGGESAFKKELAFTSKEAALQGAKVAFVNMNCFHDLVNSKEMKGKLPPEGKVKWQNKGVTYEAIRGDGVGGKVEIREVSLNVTSPIHETRAHFLDKWT